MTPPPFFFKGEDSEVDTHSFNPQTCLLGEYLCMADFFPDFRMLMSVRDHTHASLKRWSPGWCLSCQEEATFLTPAPYLWKNFYVPLPFVTSLENNCHFRIYGKYSKHPVIVSIKYCLLSGSAHL